MFKEELKDAKRLIKPLVDYLQTVDNVYYIEGNHEERYRKAIANSLKELVDVVPDLNEILAKHDLIPKNTRYIIVKEHGFLKVDKIFLMHGHEMGNKSSTNPTQSLLRKAGTSNNIVFGHFHKYGLELFNNINDKTIFALSMPMAGDKRVRYLANPQFHNGFGIYTVEKDRDSVLDIYVISESGRKIKELITSIR
ncbi:MAG: hypothetical protein QXU27_02595 [Candidatus Anstonellales archaeon]